MPKDMQLAQQMRGGEEGMNGVRKDRVQKGG